MSAGLVEESLIESAKAVGVPGEIAEKMPLAFERAINNGRASSSKETLSETERFWLSP